MRFVLLCIAFLTEYVIVNSGLTKEGQMNVLIAGLIVATVSSMLVWCCAEPTVEKSEVNTTGLKEYRTRTGTKLYCLQGGGKRKPVPGGQYGTVS